MFVWPLSLKLERSYKLGPPVHETGFPRLRFFTSYFIDGRVFFRILIFISYSTICFWVRVCKYTKIKGLDSRAKEQKRDERGASFQSSPKINRVLITTRLHTMKVYNTRPVCLPIEVLLIKFLLFSTNEVFTCVEVISTLSWTDPFRKSSTSFSLIFLKLSSQKKTWPSKNNLVVVSHT